MPQSHMAEPFFNIVRPSRIAGSLLVVSAIVAFLGSGSLSIIPAALGLALLVVQDTSKLDVLRLVVFGWFIMSLLLTIPAAISEGLWVPAVRAGLFGGSVVGLMLEGLREPTIGALALVGFGAVLF